MKKTLLAVLCFACVACICLGVAVPVTDSDVAGGTVPTFSETASSSVGQSTFDSLPAPNQPIPDGLEVWDGTVATSFAGGDGTVQDPYQISNGAEWALLMNLVSNFTTVDDQDHPLNGARYAALNYVVTNDICFNPDYTYAEDGPTSDEIANKGLRNTPAATPGSPFDGVLDANGYCFYNIYVARTSGYEYAQGLFAIIGGTVKNLHLVRGYVKGYQQLWATDKNCGTLCGALTGILQGCSSSASNKMVDSSASIGGLVGTMSQDGTIADCEFRGTVYSKARNAGGIVGSCSGVNTNLKLSNCINRGTVKCTDSSTDYVGGIIGRVGNGKIPGFFMTTCVNYGSVEGRGLGIGGIAGYIGKVDTGRREITHCTNFGNVTGYCSNVGGLVGRFEISNNSCTFANMLKVSHCYNHGTVYGSQNVGGLIGNVIAPLDISLCGNTGDVTGTIEKVGGFVGMFSANVSYSAGDSLINVSACYQRGNVTALVRTAGGLVGEIRTGTASSGLSLGGSLVGGSVTSNDIAGGLVGVFTQERGKTVSLSIENSVIHNAIYIAKSDGSTTPNAYGRWCAKKDAGITVNLTHSKVYNDDLVYMTQPGQEPVRIPNGIFMPDVQLSLAEAYSATHLSNQVYLNILNLYCTKYKLTRWEQGPELPEHKANAQVLAMELSREYDGAASRVFSTEWTGTTPHLQWYEYDSAEDIYVPVWRAPTNAGRYRVQVALTSDRAAGAITVDFTISPMLVDLSTYSWQTETGFTYNGREQSVIVKDLPAALNVTYASYTDSGTGRVYANTATDFGTYYAKLESVTDSTGNYEIINLDAVGECTWSIATLQLDANNITWGFVPDGGSLPTLTYNGEEQSICLIDRSDPSLDLSVLLNITYDGVSATSAGTYEATAVVTKRGDVRNVNVIHTLQTNHQTSWVMQKRVINPEDYIIFDDLTVTYDKTAHEIAFDRGELPSCVAVYPSIDNAPHTNAGEYVFNYMFTLTDDANNYLSDGTVHTLTQTAVERTLTVKQAIVKISASGADFVYDGSIKQIEEGSFTVSGSSDLKEEAEATGSLRYEYYHYGNLTGEPFNAINAGQYTVKVIFDPGANTNFAETYITVPMYINQAECPLPGTVVMRDAQYIYDGNPKNIFLQNEEELSRLGYVHAVYSPAQTEVGTYTVVCNFVYSSAMEGNYKPIPPMTATMTILTYELHDEETGVSVMFPTGNPTTMRLLVEARDDADSYNTSWQVGWYTAMQELYQIEFKQGYENVYSTEFPLRFYLPVTEEMRNSWTMSVVRVNVDENGGYTLTEIENWDFEKVNDVTCVAFDASETGLFGIVTGEPPAGMNTWWVIAAVVCIPSLLVVVAGLFDRAKKKKKSKS